ncbi:MAG: 30S ribosomal protein S16 [Proteobacteria bacterium]|nr:30S ribosomal protein S16 [Pseudomonadota bacterium]
MVKLRLRRIGKKKYPIYKLVATDSRAPRNGRYLEALGNYDPHAQPISLTFNEDRVFRWLKKGAQPTDTVRSLLRRNGSWLRWSLMKRGTEEAKVEALVEQWKSQQEEKLRREVERKARRSARKKKAAQTTAETPQAAAEEPAARAEPAASA